MSRTSKLLIAAFVVALPLAAHGQRSRSAADTAYCAELSRLYARYVGNSEFDPSYGRKPEVAGRVAIYQCNTGDTASAIPVLERKLNDAKVTLPPRG